MISKPFSAFKCTSTPFSSPSSCFNIMRGIDYILSKEKVIIINILYLTYLFPTAGEMASNLRSRNYFWYEQISQSGTKFCDFSQFSNSLKSAKHQTLVTAGHSHPKLPRSYWDNVPACFYIFSVMSCILMAFKWSLLEISFPFFFFPSFYILTKQC